MVSLPDLARELVGLGIMDKAFSSMCREEVEALISAVFSCIDTKTVPVKGWTKPYLKPNPVSGQQDLVIPFDTHPDYMWWKPGGKSVYETLVELKAPLHVVQRYSDRVDDVPF